MRPLLLHILSITFLLAACSLATALPTATAPVPMQTPIPATIAPTNTTIPSTPTASINFLYADGSRPLTFPQDFGAHSDFRTEWWYYTGNLQSNEGRHFGFELTIFRVGLLPPGAELPANSVWSSREVYFAHFTVSDIENDRFHAFQRYARPEPGLAGAEGLPYRVWLEDWNITETSTGVYRLQAQQNNIMLDLILTDELGIILHGDNGYSRKGRDVTNASYYYSQPRLRAEGFVTVPDGQYPVRGLAWKDHEFSTSVLDEDQIGWDWFSLQFEDGRALMLFQLREQNGNISDFASGTFINADGASQSLHQPDFDISVLDYWSSPNTQGLYPSRWEVHIDSPTCTLSVEPWMADQEVNFPPITYWEGAVKFQGMCDGVPVAGNGYIELTGYAGKLPLP